MLGAVDLAAILETGAIPSDIEAALPPDGELPTISKDFGRALVRLLGVLRPRSVLEFGAGASSVVVAMALRRNGTGRLTTVEHAPQYSAQSWERVRSERDLDARLIPAPLVLRLSLKGLLYQYEVTPDFQARAPYDFVVVDAPPGVCGRDTTLYQVLPYLERGATLMLDDTARVQEHTVVNRWLRACPGLSVVYSNSEIGRGIVLLKYDGDGTLKTSIRNWLGSCHDRWIYRASVRTQLANDARGG